MEDVRTVRIDWYPPEPSTGAKSIVAIGTFDGVHLGHQAILRSARRLAERLEARAVALTFDPHPRLVVAPDAPPPLLLTPLSDRVALLREYGAEAVAVLGFDREVAALEPETFVSSVLCARLQCSGVVAGFNFTFGRDRSGTAATLREIGEKLGLVTEIVPPVQLQGQAVSSSLIRQLVERGEVEGAGQLLGRPYRVAGEVVRGEGRGRQLGYPTANIRPDPAQQLPGDGVYLALLDQMPALAVVSTRPTFGPGARWLEVHVVEGSPSLYGRRSGVEFLRFLRPIRRFSGVDDLVAQIGVDRERALEYFASATEKRPRLLQGGSV
ncbi:bifunctional riboflavin kinase/FAD synthetase [Carboxydochorda subterranea]|uniref:Riboflavin biosynthesis protein n=1 Tax=Carboxydichorda subterranea TaxID=3109565 RepID=A0ABZ1C2N2_9FIRM|nr:bifunctional riboflavin kinase/FAD synthetase [Limnochorda sp. L945t]WRP18487.1 bifunctional riboflavin kinase/FAD synthetase [Limnochorda sp. L945t]